LLLSNLLTTET